MLSSQTLRSILKDIYGIDDKYLVPISTNWYVPTIDPEDKTNTWIGYRILSKRPTIRAYQGGVDKVKPIKVAFRITFVGKRAEDLADSTLFWEDRTDVTDAFAKEQAQVNYTDRIAFTYPVRQGGMNDEMCWVVDMTAQTFYTVDTNQHPWFSPRD